MPVTFTYTSSYTAVGSTANGWIDNRVSPPPGFAVSAFTVQLAAALPVEYTGELMVTAGTGSGSGIQACNIFAGNTVCSSPTNATIPSGATEVALYHLLQNIPVANLPLTVNVTIQVTYSDISASGAICQYGTTGKQPLLSIAEVGPGLIDAMGFLAGSPWAAPFLLAHAASVVALNTLCSGPPNAPVTIDQSDWWTTDFQTELLVAEEKLLHNFQIELWHFFCK